MDHDEGRNMKKCENQSNQTRKRRFVAELGAFLAGVGVYANYKNIQKIKENKNTT